MKMTPVDLTELNIEETGPSAFDMAVVIFFAVLSCAFAVFANSDHFGYLEGLGKYHGGSFQDAILLGVATLIAIFSVIVIVMNARAFMTRSTVLKKLFFVTLLIMTLAVPIASYSRSKPGYQIFTRGFADRVKTRFNLNAQGIQWLQARALLKPNDVSVYDEWPQPVQAAIQGITAPWEPLKSWRLTFEKSRARFTVDNGTFSIPRGLAIRLDGSPLPASDPEEYIIPITGEIYVFTRTHDNQ